MHLEYSFIILIECVSKIIQILCNALQREGGGVFSQMVKIAIRGGVLKQNSCIKLYQITLFTLQMTKFSKVCLCIEECYLKFTLVDSENFCMTLHYVYDGEEF
jgi:hypothetical protein